MAQAATARSPVASSASVVTMKRKLEGINFDRMSTETRAFTDLLLEMGHMKAAAIAGDVLTDRARRAAGVPGCPADI